MRTCSVIKSISPRKSSLSALIPAESVSSTLIISVFSPLSEYRAVSSSLSIYKTTAVTLKNYLIVTDLYMRYAPLKSIRLVKSIKFIKFLWIRFVTTSFKTISILIVKDLYERFHRKEKLVIFAVKLVSESSANQILSLRNSKYRFEASILSAKTLSFIIYKFIPRSLIT